MYALYGTYTLELKRRKKKNVIKILVFFNMMKKPGTTFYGKVPVDNRTRTKKYAANEPNNNY